MEAVVMLFGIIGGMIAIRHIFKRKSEKEYRQEHRNFMNEKAGISEKDADESYKTFESFFGGKTDRNPKESMVTPSEDPFKIFESFMGKDK